MANWIKKKGRRKNAPDIFINEKWYTFDTETVIYSEDEAYISDWVIYDGETPITGGHVYDAMFHVEQLSDGGDECHRTVFYIQNLGYDWQFIKRFAIQLWGEPVYTLATKPHKYISIVFSNGVFLRDSAILAQSKLEKFAEEMGVTEKAVGKWDYSKRRVPGGPRTADEMEYLTKDAISLWESLDRFFRIFGTDHVNTQNTRTGFIRKEARTRALKDPSHRRLFQKMRMTPEQYAVVEMCYHGGNSHGNRFYIGEVLKNLESYDIGSSYPSRLVYEKYPSEGFRNVEYSIKIDDILAMDDMYAFCGFVVFYDLKIKDGCLNPPISRHKCIDIEGCGFMDMDNGRVLKADCLCIAFSDPDLRLYSECYEYNKKKTRLINVYQARKDYLPEWFCEFLSELFKKKTKLKDTENEDEYMKAKYAINGCYGMTVQKIVRDDHYEDFSTGEWKTHDKNPRKQLEEYYENSNSFLPYQWGVWCTAYAQKELYLLNACCGDWVYGDTDSGKGREWDKEKVEEFNDRIREMAKRRGVEPVVHNGKEYLMGIAENEGAMTEFVTLGSKRYAYRNGKGLHITVAGVPKEGAAELKNDIYNFKEGMVFKKIDKLACTYVEKDIHKLIVDNVEIYAASSAILKHVNYNLSQTLPFDNETGIPLEIFVSEDFS